MRRIWVNTCKAYRAYMLLRGYSILTTAIYIYFSLYYQAHLWWLYFLALLFVLLLCNTLSFVSEFFALNFITYYNSNLLLIFFFLPVKAFSLITDWVSKEGNSKVAIESRQFISECSWDQHLEREEPELDRRNWIAEQSQCFGNSEEDSRKVFFFNIPPSREQMFYQDTSCTCHFLLNQSNLRNVINIADNIEWCFERCSATQVSSDYFMTEIRRVNRALKQGCKCTLLSFPSECELFQFSFRIGMEKNAFARSKVAYHVSEALLIFSSNDTTVWQNSCN